MKPIVTDLGGEYATEWYCHPPIWGGRYIVTSQDWVIDAHGRPVRRIWAWTIPGGLQLFSCEGYTLRVVAEW